jgi:hypothetical protein
VVLKYAESLLKQNPANNPAFEAKCIALFAQETLPGWDSLDRNQTATGTDEPLGAIFQARFASNSGQTEMAIQRYTEAAPYVPVEICEEAGTSSSAQASIPRNSFSFWRLLLIQQNRCSPEDFAPKWQ